MSLADAGLDGTTAVGRMTLQLCAVFAEFERSLLRERTLAGLAAARARGAVVGRPRRELDLRAAHVLLGQGHSLRAVATMLGLPRATLALRGAWVWTTTVPRRGRRQSGSGQETLSRRPLTGPPGWTRRRVRG